jgi:hypothetical protein
MDTATLVKLLPQLDSKVQQLEIKYGDKMAGIDDMYESRQGVAEATAYDKRGITVSPNRTEFGDTSDWQAAPFTSRDNRLKSRTNKTGSPTKLPSFDTLAANNRGGRNVKNAIKLRTGQEYESDPSEYSTKPHLPEQGVVEGRKNKKKVKEGMEHRLKAARHAGRSHALAKESYNCRYDDMEEAKCYHEGYKEGLDECYGRGVYENAPMTPPATIGGMAQQAEPAMEDDMYEMDKTQYMQHKAKTTPGGSFKAFGQIFKDKEVLESPFAFEAWDKELNALLESKEEVAEGMSVSISTGNQGMSDSVTVSAQDHEAESLLGLIKQAGLGLFGDKNIDGYGAPKDSDVAHSHGDINVVGDHDGMMS